ncbi:MAG: glycerol-3-phosphate dehydrogenase/oxidase [Propionibacteriaceae bacterium]|jgi:glycerol-3-phosphate dehydrogenase|nr:glycerol-3-phosphate dehydrogenase/oxidase [Propionibacteriaceae bacterium]
MAIDLTPAGLAPLAGLGPLADSEFDLIVVGGGVTGAACARDAALRGLKVLLLEKDDFAAGTSSRSSKMIHGGLRYLETYQFKLVREGVKERELALRLAPHLTTVAPHLYLVYDGDPYGLGQLNFALSFYDVFSGQWRRRRHRMLSPAKVLAREPHLNPKGLRGAGLYFDVLTDDARFTLDVVKGAVEAGAVALNHVLVTGLVRSGDKVTAVSATDQLDQKTYQFHAKAVVNATGPWTGRLVAQEHGAEAAPLRPSKGVHVVFDKADFPLDTVVFLRSPTDRRVTWPAPSLEDDRVYVGTTDTDYDGDPDQVEPTEQDIQYLLDVANHTIPDARLDASHIVGSWAGLRPLVAPSAPGTTTGLTSREHKVEVGPGGMVTVSGGKLTSQRVMGQHVVDTVVARLGLQTRPYSADRAPISGGRPEAWAAARAELESTAAPEPVRQRWLRYYGSAATALVALWLAGPENRVEIGPRHVTAAEVRYNVAHEGCRTLDDLMVRRTSLFFWDRAGGLDHIEALADLMADLLGWDRDRRRQEIADYAAKVCRHRPGQVPPAAAAYLTPPA